ncbi:MAG: hypothetical protein HY867_12610 [Chloroflexi bacterium]|nr:hypothetical protein [Chloroflexota bacterium]
MKFKTLNMPSTKHWAIFVVIVLFSTLFSPIKAKTVFGQGGKVEVGETKVQSSFPKGIRFNVTIDTEESLYVYFWYKLGAGTWQVVDPNRQTILVNGHLDYYNCVFFLDMSNMPPQLPVSYKWEAKNINGGYHKFSEVQTIIYSDSNYAWESLSSKGLTIWWHDHPKDFGEHVMTIAETSIQNQSKIFGMELPYPIQIVIENSQEEFLSWNTQFPSLGSVLTYYRFGLTIQIIEPETKPQWQEYLLSDIIPSGISHLYFFEASGRKQKSPPEWLEAGLTKYNELHPHEPEWAMVRDAIKQGGLIPLSELRNDFDEDDIQIYLAYAESYTVIEYIISVYGEEGLHTLFENYRNYKTSDEAFEAAFGKNVAEVEADWEVWIKTHPNVTSLSDKLQPYIPSILIVTVVCSFLVFATILVAITYFSRRKQAQPNS